MTDLTPVTQMTARRGETPGGAHPQTGRTALAKGDDRAGKATGNASRTDAAPPATAPHDAGATTRPADADPAPAPGLAPQAEERATRPAMLRGFRRRCPHCGQGHLFDGYLKVKDRCPVCREELFHHRADDGPAYLTILVVGHLMAPLIHVAFTTFRPEPLVMATVFTVGCVALSLYLLPRLKGVVVAIQWARRMHGFRLTA